MSVTTIKLSYLLLQVQIHSGATTYTSISTERAKCKSLLIARTRRYVPLVKRGIGSTPLNKCRLNKSVILARYVAQLPAR